MWEIINLLPVTIVCHCVTDQLTIRLLVRHLQEGPVALVEQPVTVGYSFNNSLPYSHYTHCQIKICMNCIIILLYK